MTHMTDQMPEPGLSDRQRRIVDFIAAFLASRGYPPTVREIGEATGLLSTSSVHYQLRTLQRLGIVIRESNRSRTVTLNKAAA